VAQAKASLGNMFQEGQGVPLDSTPAATQAATSYRKAAEKGDATAQYSLGAFYNRGKGVPQDYSQAVVWYRKAAEQGLYDAQLALGGMYRFGLGVPKDYTEAVAWYRKAAAQGNFIAQQQLDGLLEDMGVSQVASPAAPGPSKDGSEVILRRQGGTFLIPVSINNAISLNFIIDSGAADVSIPYEVVKTLMRTGTINRDDFLVSQTYTLADGSHVPSETFRIRSLKVGDREIQDVTGSVAKIEGSLLLGQSFLTRFKSWSINNERGVLVLK
jgi:clan AA aspartic protease (TIGR02281 family)